VEITYYRLFSVAVLLAASTTFAPSLGAKDKKAEAPGAKDAIEVVGHIPQTGGPVRRFVATQHYSSYYLYAEHEAGGNITLIDVTKTSQPAVLADVAYAPNGGAGSLTVVAGTAALVSSEPASSTAAQQPQTFRIMDFSDPKNPKVAREFTGVTAMSRDNQRGLMFVANADGIWILQQRFAEDPEVQRAYEDYVIYGSSMYPPRR
jgi:hypothetical protein